MNILSALYSLVALSQLVAAAPSKFNCPTTTDILQLPPSQTQLAVPPGESPAYIMLGLGVQNYTCNATSSHYVSKGAYAALYDISCEYGTSKFDALVDTAFSWLPDTPDLLNKLKSPPTAGLLGFHYFVTTGSGISAKWDFTGVSQKSDPNAFVVGSKIGDVPAPNNTTDVDWLELTNAQGDLAKTVFRVQTKGGQPPSSCKAGTADISVNYVAQYWLYK
ncbi:hypothetical protein BOTBODRAFT_179293 [Botryobasidium botryosum FD-172 SS1]|uniref:Malate dehydrogenase n=1 Tax=Botryobasidium botryosum (strain FD-172 SS1) TaxID=930990 RepID=A0A067MBZ3_BOTB1|nr:hypothetical protein BOTBODRAFT_179293 [Botryobasidium botryosum FD-172 SS1]